MPVYGKDALSYAAQEHELRWQRVAATTGYKKRASAVPRDALFFAALKHAKVPVKLEDVEEQCPSPQAVPRGGATAQIEPNGDIDPVPEGAQGQTDVVAGSQLDDSSVFSTGTGAGPTKSVTASDISNRTVDPVLQALAGAIDTWLQIVALNPTANPLQLTPQHTPAMRRRTMRQATAITTTSSQEKGVFVIFWPSFGRSNGFAA